MSVADGGGGIDESTDVVPDEDEDVEDRCLSSLWTSTFRVGGTAVTTAAAFLVLLPPPGAAAFRFLPFLLAAPVAVTGAGIGAGAGAIAAGLGAMGLNLSTICHAWPVGARQHPAFLSIVQTGGSRSSLCCFLGGVRVDHGVWHVVRFNTTGIWDTRRLSRAGAGL
jgi:hypothetical protein